MSWLKNVKPGDELFLVPSSRYGANRPVKVEKVGRKWITLMGGAGRLDINQKVSNEQARIEQHYGSPDAVYPNEEAYLYRVEMSKLRRAVYDAVVTHGSLTDDQIKAIAELIGIGYVPVSLEVKP